jgi:enoyl-CoA hydratase/carnithine racemase
VASDDAVFRLPFIDLGIVPEAASTQLLQRAIGLPRAKRLLLGGELFNGTDAHAWGLVAEICAAPDIVARSWERARLLASKDPAIVRRIKDWLHPVGEYHQRINEEVVEINAAVARRRSELEDAQ